MLMKIDLHPTFKHLGVLVFMFQQYYPTSTPFDASRDVKVTRSVLDNVVMRIRKKYMAEEGRHNYRPKGKHFKIPLEYHEAFVLLGFLDMVATMQLGEYDKNVVNMLRRHLDEKLT